MPKEKTVLKKIFVYIKKAIKMLIYIPRAYFAYWKYTKVPKEKNLWVFSGFRHASYMDNTKYFYEYILENHPEINAVWLTTNGDIYKKLKDENKPVYMMDSPEGTAVMSRAQIAVTDHFVMTDFSPVYGFNDKTKVVQLWHGVGFKSMGDEKRVKNTTERGVRYSRDIFPSDGDGSLTLRIKKLKYRFLAPFREKFESYFLFIVTGRERIDAIVNFWKVPKDALLRAGQPRSLPLYNARRQTKPFKIIYAPTYRFNENHERAVVEGFLRNAEALQRLMDETDAEIYLRLHPHTWRRYDDVIENGIKNFDRIFTHTEKDVYSSLGSFSLLISDYSSISLDFVSLDRPVIFFCPDYDWFIQNEAGFNVDYKAVIPGLMTENWDDTMALIKGYALDYDKDAKLRRERMRYFFYSDVNNKDDCERIALEIKKKTGIS